MKAAVLYDIKTPLQIEEFTLPNILPDQVRVRLVASGVCHSDWHVIKGDWPHIPVPTILGHEGAGVVEEVGEKVGHVRKGDHVVLSWKRNCGLCEMCQSGYPNLCDEVPDQRALPRFPGGDRTMNKLLGLGTFSTETIVPGDVVIAIDKEIPLQQAALVGCGVMTGVGAVIHTSNVRPGDTVAVIGCGGVGLAAVNGAALAGAGRIIAIDMAPGKENLAKSMGATDFVLGGPDAVKTVLEMTRGGVQHSFEAIGLAVTAEQSFNMLARGGTANVIGMIPVGQTISLMGAAFLGEKRIQGSLMGSNRFPVDMPRLVDAYMAGKLHLDDMISRRIQLEQVNEAFEEMKTGAVARSVIVFN